jgi:hypothetical protein
MPKNHNNNDEIVIKAKDLDLDQLSFTKLEPNENCYGQLTALPKYTDAETPLMIQTHKIPMDFYGVPRLDKYHEDDSKRDYCQIPLNPANKDCAKLLETMKSIDDWASTPEFRKTVGLSEDYTYSGIVKTPDVKPGEKTATGKPKIDIPSFKAKFSIDWETKQIDTGFMREEVIDGEKKIVNIKNTQTPDDVTKNALPYKSKSIFILQLIKLWAKPPAKSEKQKKSMVLDYGLQWRIVKAKVESPAKGNSTLKEIKTSDKFLDSEEDEDAPAPATQSAKSKVVEKEKEKEKDEDDDDDDEEEKPAKIIKVVTKATKQIAQIESDDDSDDDSEEEEKPKAKVVAKGKVVAKKSKESDDDDDDDEEEEVKPKAKAPAKAPAKKGGKSVNA